MTQNAEPEQMAAATTTMTARTQTMTLQPSRWALAAQSLAAVDRIPDAQARYQAFSAHLRQFPPTIASF